MSISLTVMSIDFDSFEAPQTKSFSGNEVKIGRDSDNDLVLDRPEVSSKHAKIYLKKNIYSNSYDLYVQDLGSSNGTMVERDAIEAEKEVKIQANQRLIIGSYLIKPNFNADIVVEESTNGNHNYKTKEPELFGLEELSVNADTENLKLSSNFPDYHAPHTKEFKTTIEEAITNFAVTEVKESITIEPQQITEEIKHNELAFDSSTAETIIAPQKEEEQIKITEHAKTSDTAFEVIETKVLVSNNNIFNIDFVATELYNLKGRIHHHGHALDMVLVDAGSLGKTYSDHQGYFEFKSIEEGTNYHLNISKDGYVFESTTLKGILDSSKEIEIVATKLFSISGKVLHKGQGLDGVLIDISGVGSSTTTIDGSFRFNNIKEGTEYKVSVIKNKFKFDLLEGTGIINRDIDLKINAQQLLNIGGRILHKGKAVVGVEVECINIGKTSTDSNGIYYFEDVPEGQEYTIRAKKPGYAFKQIK